MKHNHCILLVGILILGASSAWGQRRSRVAPTGETRSHMTYDLGASTGSYNGYSYSEITLGLNWYMSDYLVWRNAAFSRFGSQVDSALGVDTSLRFIYDTKADRDSVGVTVFGGPGYRLSSEKYSGYFLEGGALLKFGGLSLGGGIKSITYTSPGKKADGTDNPKTDSVLFIILAGGGAF